MYIYILYIYILYIYSCVLIPVQSKFNFYIILTHFDYFLVSFLVSICYVPKHLKNSKTNDVN